MKFSHSLWPGQAPRGDGTYTNENTFITVYRPEKPNGAAIVICPGGGYGCLAVDPEGHLIAQWLNAHGITGIVLEYRLPRGHAFVPLLDAQRTIRTVRATAMEWGCDPQRIGIMGFSAGGHLVSTAATHFDQGNPSAKDSIEQMSCRPDFAILIYPVIFMGEKAHAGSKLNLMGQTPTPALEKFFSTEKQVTEKTPPAFLAHAQDDTGVPPNNSLFFYEALKACGVPAEYLKLPSGGHGLNGYKGPMWDLWQTRSLEWMASLKIIPQSAIPSSAVLNGVGRLGRKKRRGTAESKERNTGNIPLATLLHAGKNHSATNSKLRRNGP